MNSEETAAENYEKEYVHNIYEKIADNFSRTRYNVWPSVKAFMDTIDANASVLEVGCGNGKNLAYLDWVPDKVGCDVVAEFVAMVHERGIKCCIGNAVDLPFETNQFDYTLSVAVLHHLSTTPRRLCALNELIRVTKPGGTIYVQVWAFEQNLETEGIVPNKPKKFETQDTFVSWNGTCDRYYHVFVKGELESLVSNTDTATVTIIDSHYDYGNWVIVLKKNIDTN